MALLEPVRMGQRPGGADLVQQLRLGTGVDPDGRERALRRLVGIAGQQLERRRQLLGDVVQDQPFLGLALGLVHRRQR